MFGGLSEGVRALGRPRDETHRAERPSRASVVREVRPDGPREGSRRSARPNGRLCRRGVRPGRAVLALRLVAGPGPHRPPAPGAGCASASRARSPAVRRPAREKAVGGGGGTVVDGSGTSDLWAVGSP